MQVYTHSGLITKRKKASIPLLRAMEAWAVFNWIPESGESFQGSIQASSESHGDKVPAAVRVSLCMARVAAM